MNSVWYSSLQQPWRYWPLLLVVGIIGLSVGGFPSAALAQTVEPEHLTTFVVDQGEPDAAAASLLRAPTPQRADYPNIGVSSRSIVWVIAQMHLFFGALVLAVPIFVLIIE